MQKVYVCEMDELINCKRKQISVENRNLLILYHKSKVYALDSFCYHAGGPLYLGDIEEYGGHSCIKCPWHNYRICIDNGEGLYQSINPFNLSEPPQIKSKGVKQRTYKVIQENGQIYIELNTDSKKYESDYYNDKENREKLQLN